MPHLAHSQPMAHRHRPGTDEALLTRHQQCSLHRAASRIGPIQHPDLLAMRRPSFEQIEQRGDEGVDAAAEVLQIEQKHIGSGHHLPAGAAQLSVKAEDRDVVGRIERVWRFDHVVLLVALQPVLRAEGGSDV